MKNATLILILFVVVFSGCNSTIQNWQHYTSSVVLIEIDGRHTGSGFVVAPDLIITARHIVNKRGNYAVVLADGSKRNVQAIRISKETDCAVLLVRKTSFRPLILTTKIEVGQPIFVVGSPLNRKFFNYVTYGIVSKIDVIHSRFSGNPLIMIDAAANPGNSGGPVFDSSGKVIGIFIARYPHNCGLNFITPSIDIITLLEDWKDANENHEGRYQADEEQFTEEY